MDIRPKKDVIAETMIHGLEVVVEYEEECFSVSVNESIVWIIQELEAVVMDVRCSVNTYPEGVQYTAFITYERY